MVSNCMRSLLCAIAVVLREPIPSANTTSDFIVLLQDCGTGFPPRLWLHYRVASSPDNGCSIELQMPLFADMYPAAAPCYRVHYCMQHSTATRRRNVFPPL